MDDYHIPVLLAEVLENLKVESGKRYIDCTLGGGGHSREIVGRGGILLSLDQDQDAIDYVRGRIEDGGWKIDRAVLVKQWIIKKTNFTHLKEIATEAGFEKVSGILFDLGVSSHQLETDYRGFSFNKEGKLDMRMDRELSVTAADLVNAGGESELAHLFWRYGEEIGAKKIARAIVDYRKTKKIETTNELAGIILQVRRRGAGDRMHPATRVFQALRIAVNNELENLQMGLSQAVELLDPGGRLAVISFHSLEDRIVKDFMKDNVNTNKLRIITDKPVMATEAEILKNPRARSGKLRVAERI